MSDGPFRVISKVKVGALEGEQLEEWNRLFRMHRRLAREQNEFEAAMDAFIEGVNAQFKPPAPDLCADPDLRIGSDGEISLAYCQCPKCQAVLHGMTVVETVEAMYEQKLIPEEAIHEVRAKAKAIDARLETSKRYLN